LCYAALTSMRRDCNPYGCVSAGRDGSAGQVELRLRRPRHGERRYRRDLRLPDGHDLDAHRRAAKSAHLLERCADHDSIRCDEKDLLGALVDHLDRGDVAGLRGQRREDHPLATTALRRELRDGGPLAEAVLSYGERLGPGPGDPHADDLVALLQPDAGDTLRLPAHRPGIRSFESDRFALPRGEEDAVL